MNSASSKERLFLSSATSRQRLAATKTASGKGLPNAGVPPCATCHNGAGSYPHLDGQHPAYMARQLRLRKAGLGPSTEAAGIMTPIAQRLSNEDIDAVSNYF